MPRPTHLLVLLLSTLLAGTAVAQPGATPPSSSAPADPYAGPRADRPDRPGRVDRRGHARAGRQRLAPAVRARLIARFDRNGDGRLTGPERRAAKRFVRQLRRQMRSERRAQGGFGGR